MSVSKTNNHFQIKIKIQITSQEPSGSSKAQNQDLNFMHVVCTFKSRKRAKIWINCVSGTIDHIQIKIKIPKPSQEPHSSSKVPNQNLEDIDVLCTFKIKIESQNLELGCNKNQWPYPNQDKDPKPQSRSSEVPNQDLNDKDVLWTFKIKIESQNSDHGCIKTQWWYPNKIHVLTWGFGGCWRFLIGVWHLDLDLDMVNGLWYTHDSNFDSLSWFWRCKEHPCPLSPHLGLLRTLEVPDWRLASW